MHCLLLSTRLFLMNGLLFHLPKTIWCYTEHLLEAADELPRIIIADLIVDSEVCGALLENIIQKEDT